MKKNITLLLISLFVLISCSSDEDSPVVVTPPSPTAIQAVLNGGSVNVTWSVVEGTGITYNIYRSDSPVKLNTTPLTEAKFTDVLKSTGSFTYTITANLGGVESAKGAVSEKVILELPKTISTQTITGFDNTTYEYGYTYDTSNITKLATLTTKTTTIDLKTLEVTITKSTAKYTYTGDLITKIMYYNEDNTLNSYGEYVYNEEQKLETKVYKNPNGIIFDTTSYVYKEDGTINEIDEFPNSNPRIYTLEKGNWVKYSVIAPMTDDGVRAVVRNSVFDSKNDSNVNILGLNRFVGNNKNNEISSSSVYTLNGTFYDRKTFKNEYTYNQNGYFLTKTQNFTVESTGITVKTEETVVTYY